ncbi:hypothetical protein ECE50_027750 [Chitinophaga sp. Mgbs1]|uniref:Uncharacterized protein n=1 Tax=Chitinophaga solisilvae TaxID=1233460 RepID=A0A433WCW9_9BACT|nr:hypothetical protein [Chitinophaga solisilvae]
MKATALLLPLLGIAIAAHTQTRINKTPMKAPESVIIHDGYYYISDTGGDPTKKDGDGVIYKMTPQGDVTVFADSLDSPKGSAIFRNILYVTDVDHIRGYDLRNGKQVFNLDMSATGSVLLNDITPRDENSIFVSATDINKIYIVQLGNTPSFEEVKISNPIRGANGLAYDSKRQRLYACGFGSLGTPDGQIGYIDLSAPEKKFVPLTTRTGYYDGITLTKNNKLIISDWVAFEKKGVIIELDINNGKVVTLNKEPISGPADFTIDKSGKIITPAMMEGNVMRF